MKTSKFGALFLISIMALAGVTAGYAIWNETLTIDGAVNTGTFEVSLTSGTTGSNEATPTSTITAIVDSSGNTMAVTIDDAYPDITYYVNFQVSNDGTIPAEFDAWDINYQTLGGLSTITITPTLGSVAITATTLLAAQTWDGILEVTLTDGAVMNTPYTFQITLNAYQTT